MEAFSDFITAIIRCEDRAVVGEVVKAEIGKFGFSSSVCLAHETAIRGSQPDTLFRNWTPDWLKHSTEQKLSEKSFVLSEARRRRAPFTWVEAASQRSFSKDEHQVLDEARSFGWKNGLVVPIHGPVGYLGLFSMATEERDIDLLSETSQRLAMIGYLAHQRCIALAPADRSIAVRAISHRESECLYWVAAGKTDREIGIILSLSPHTVKMHIKSARCRLGASTRAQAAALLAMAGRL